MFAIVDIAGFQEKVSEGDALRVPHLEGDEGAKVVFENVFLVADGDKVTLGTPVVSGASVEVKVVKHGKDKKIRVLKMKRRKRYRRVHGHRQEFTDIEVVKIKASGSKAAAPKAEKATEEKATADKPAAKKAAPKKAAEKKEEK